MRRGRREATRESSSFPVVLVFLAIVGVGGGAFYLGRSTPAPAPIPATELTPVDVVPAPREEPRAVEARPMDAPKVDAEDRPRPVPNAADPRPPATPPTLTEEEVIEREFKRRSLIELAPGARAGVPDEVMEQAKAQLRRQVTWDVKLAKRVGDIGRKRGASEAVVRRVCNRAVAMNRIETGDGTPFVDDNLVEGIYEEEERVERALGK